MSYRYAMHQKTFTDITDSIGIAINIVGIYLSISKRKQIKNHLVNKTYCKISLWIINFSIAGMVASLTHSLCYVFIFGLGVLSGR